MKALSPLKWARGEASQPSFSFIFEVRSCCLLRYCRTTRRCSDVCSGAVRSLQPRPGYYPSTILEWWGTRRVRKRFQSKLENQARRTAGIFRWGLMCWISWERLQSRERKIVAQVCMTTHVIELIGLVCTTCKHSEHSLMSNQSRIQQPSSCSHIDSSSVRVDWHYTKNRIRPEIECQAFEVRASARVWAFHDIH